jgi:hypothetical protein
LATSLALVLLPLALVPSMAITIGFFKVICNWLNKLNQLNELNR